MAKNILREGSSIFLSSKPFIVKTCKNKIIIYYIYSLLHTSDIENCNYTFAFGNRNKAEDKFTHNQVCNRRRIDIKYRIQQTLFEKQK